MRATGAAALLACALAAPSTQAQTSPLSVTVSNPYREIVDAGNVTVTLSVRYSAGLPLVVDCAVPMAVVRDGNRITLVLREVTGPQVPPAGGSACGNSGTVDLGTLRANAYSVRASLVDAQGSAVATLDSAFEVLPVTGRCAAFPMLTPQIIAQHATLSPSQLRERIIADPAYAQRLGNPVMAPIAPGIIDRVYDYAFLIYPPLVDPVEINVKLDQTKEFTHVEQNSYACGLPPPDSPATVVEFYSPTLDHYFYTADRREIDVLDTNGIAGWARTGAGFRAVLQPGCPASAPGSLGVVYRFYGVPGRGPDSHFFTRNRAECSAVDKSAQWSLEGVPFWAWSVDAKGACPDSTTQTPLYRAWRPFGDSNHRFSTDRAVIDAMVGQGWIDEGAAMCVVKPSS